MSTLEKEKIEEIKNLYTTFKEELRNDISSKTILNKKRCYLIKEPWDSELFNNNYNTNSYSRKYKRFHSNITNNNTFNFPSNPPEFINDIKTIINCLKNNEKLKLQNPELIKTVDEINKLNGRKSMMNYLAGNNKILLEYKYENEALLIENASSVPEGISKSLKNIYLIKIKLKNFRMRYKKDDLYKFLLSEPKLEKLDLEPYKNANSDIQVEIEDIFKENNSSNNSKNQTRQYEYKTRHFKKREEINNKNSMKEINIETPRGEKKEEINNKNSMKEKNIETPRDKKEERKEEIKEKSNFYGRYRRGNRQQISSAININKKDEEYNLSKNNYNKEIDNTTISSLKSNISIRRGFRNYQKNEGNQNKNEEIISNMKSSIITNSQGKENEIQKLKEEIEKLKKEKTNQINENLNAEKEIRN